MFDWYPLFSRTEFIASGLVSKEATIELGDLGEKTILITRGVSVGVKYDDTFLVLNLNGKNPVRIGDRALFVDANELVWLGIYRED